MLERAQKILIANRLEFISAALTFTVASLLYLFNDNVFYNDDQYTLYRYIDNIAKGRGFVFNPGERVLGSTTPLFTLLMAAVKYVFESVPTRELVAYFNIAALTASSFVFFRLSRLFLSERISLVASAIFALNMSRAVLTGMETPLFLLVTFSFVYSLQRGKYRSSAVCLALSFLTRPDAGLIALLAALYWWQKGGFRSAVRFASISFAVVLPWLIFSTAYFGSPIPQSLLTKLHINDIVSQSPLQGLKVQTSHLSRIFWGKIIDPDNIPLQVAVNLAPFALLVFLGAKKALSKETWILFAIPLAYFASYSISNPVMFMWYLLQTEPFWILISLTGASLAFEKLRERVPNPKAVAAAGALILLAGPLWWWAVAMMKDDEGSKVPLYMIGTYIKERMSPGDTVGISNIGIVSYVTDAHVVDFIGLTRPDSVKYYPIRDECYDSSIQYVVPPQLIIDTVPDWIVAGDTELVKCFENGEWFRSHYSQVYKVRSAIVWRLNDSSRQRDT